MAIPKYDEMYREFLDILSDGCTHKIGQIRDSLAAVFGLTEEERNLLLSSGKPIFNDRVNWTATYLKKASLIENAARGVYTITVAGKKILSENPPHIDNMLLENFDTFRDFIRQPNNQANHKKDYQQTPDETPATSSQSPQDILDNAFQQINATLAEDILAETMRQTPIFFENLVVKLLTAMGYGGSIEDAGTVTKASGDEGIDGIIREDKLGFSNIYIQAKRWDPATAIGRPELQKFVGALAGQGAHKGLFITTAHFSKEAKEYVRKQLSMKIVLIDGPALANLMIEYNVGVSVEATYLIKRIDSDFFDDN